MKFITMKTICAAFLCCGLLSGTVSAQDEEFDPKEAIKQIKKDLESSVENLAELSGGSVSAEEGKRVVDNIDKLLQGMQDSQGRVVRNIDELLLKMKNKKSNKSSSSPPSGKGGKPKSSQKPSGKKGEKQPRGSRRDRNKDPRKKGGKPEPEGSQKKDSKGESDPQGGEEGDKDLRNSEEGRKGPGSRREEMPVQIDAEGWGHLPPEVRQLLIDKNFRDYFPDYEREISDYLKSLNKRKRK